MLSITTINDHPPGSGAPLFSAVLKSEPADFIVDEVLGFDLDGAGEHLYLNIQKTGVNTDEIARLLETVFSVTSKDVGVSGMKDRHAVTSQWFSVTTPLGSKLMQTALDEFRQDHKHAKIINEARHSRKLRRGAHAGNDFVITLRGVRVVDAGAEDAQELDIDSGSNGAASGEGTGAASGEGTGAASSGGTVEASGAGAVEQSGASIPVTGPEGDSSEGANMATTTNLEVAVSQRIQWISTHGFPNYIGPQRFGIGGQNLVRARQWFRQPKKRTSRQQRSLWLSAGRSAIFNAVCAARVADGSWQQLLAGEPAVLSGTRSFFDSSDVSAEELSARLKSFDIHPSAPWWGRGRALATQACADYEQALLEPFADICGGLEKGGLSQERRAIRAAATDLTHQWIDGTTLELSFNLPPGVFATTLMSELGLCEEPVRPRFNN